jgi:glycosyltransferase involved in cell wall biosynthesis
MTSANRRQKRLQLTLDALCGPDHSDMDNTAFTRRCAAIGGMETSDRESIRVCIVAENASFRFGGEASLPLHYYSRLRARGVEAWLIVHGRTREELQALFPDNAGRIRFIPDKWFHKLIWRLNAFLPRRVAEATLGTLMVLVNQWIQRQMVRALIASDHVNVVHQPIPVSPRAPSLICKLGIPVVIGPMNGGMDYPKAFHRVESWATRASVALGRSCANLINWAIPGKKLAGFVLVANQRTRLALPSCVEGEVIEIPENGVDLGLWSVEPHIVTGDHTPRFLFMGRLVDWKRLDWAIRALGNVPGAYLDVIGDGPMRAEWMRLAASLNLSDRICFLGWMPQHECAQHLRSATALLLPSIYECGGAVVLEAMATGTPVIAVAWGGPTDYLDDTCGLLIPPLGAAAVVDGFTEGMRKLIGNPQLCFSLGAAARRKVEATFSWEEKVDRVVEIYRRAVDRVSA